MLFTATSLMKTQVTSQQFKDFGADGLAPSPVSASKVCGFKSTASAAGPTATTANIWSFVASTIFKSSFHVSGTANGVKDATARDLFPRPPMVFSMRKPVEDIVARITALGFVQQARNKFTFYKGPSTDEL